jgi:hypothetical protein
MSKRVNILLLDETEYWRSDIQKACKKIFGVYLYSPDEVTHCCELTPSYECHPMPSVAQHLPYNPEKREEMYDNLASGDANGGDVSYFHCADIEKLPILDPASKKLRPGVILYDTYDEEEFNWDDIEEQYICNPWF